jgi:hypothetical protein
MTASPFQNISVFSLLVPLALTTFQVFAQLPFSLHRKVLGENTYCMPLKQSPLESDSRLEFQLGRFSEEQLQDNDHCDVFRIVDYKNSADLRGITIRRIERFDSTCVVTLKVIKNLRKNVVFVHTKTYDISKWNDFVLLASKYFSKDSKFSAIKVVYRDNWHQKMEWQQTGNYRVISDYEGGTDVFLLRDYLEYLLSPIFENSCE